MKEYYNLPVLYTPEERQRYAQWGRQKHKFVVPAHILIVGLDLLVTGATMLRLLMYAYQDTPSPYLDALFLTPFTSRLSYLLSVGGTFLVVYPLNRLIDRLLKKPPEPMMLRLEPTVQGMHYVLSREKKTLCRGVLSWNEWDSAVNPISNEIFIERQRLRIGKNTRETIYPREVLRPWLDQPAEKIVGTIKLETIQRNMKGYLASLEAEEKTAQWIRQNSQ